MKRNRNQDKRRSFSEEPTEQQVPEASLTRRDFIKVAGGTAVVVGLATACGPAATPTAPPGETAAPAATTAPGVTPAATEAPASEATGWLIYGANQEGEGIDPAIGYTLWSRWVDDNCYDALFRFEGDPSQLVNYLAKSYEVSDDGLEFTFRLEEGVKFHDGSELKASDVVYTLKRMLAMGDAPSFLWASADPEKVEAVDDYTVKMVLKEIYGPFLMTLPWLYVVNEKLLRANEVSGDWGAAYLRNNDAGSGPFMITNFDPGVTIDMPYFPDYWKGWPGKRLDGWSYEIHREMGTLKQMLQASDMQITDRLSEDDFLVVAGFPNVLVEEHPTQQPFQIKMNNEKEPTSNVDFRKALTYAFDYDAVTTGLLQGHCTVLDSPLPPGMPGHLSLLESKKDLDKARDHLARSGYDPSQIELEFGYVEADPFQRDVGLVMQNSLKELGISVKVQGYTPALSAGVWLTPESMTHMWPIWAAADYPDPENLLYPQYHSRNWGNWYSCSYYKNDRYDELLDQARRTPELADRIPLYEEAQRILVEDAVDVWLFAWHWRTAMLDCVRGYAFQPAGMNSTYLYPMWLEQPCGRQR